MSPQPLAHVNGTVTGGVSYRDHLFRNTGSVFEDVTPEVLALQAAEGEREHLRVGGGVEGVPRQGGDVAVVVVGDRSHVVRPGRRLLDPPPVAGMR